MAEPWIRVHANLAQRKVVWRLVEALGVSKHEAIGLLVMLWGNASQFSSNGAVACLPDAQIEEWAGWRGEAGRFAQWLRVAHVDASGRFNEWDEYAGKLESWRERKRRQKADERARKQADVATMSPRQVGDNPATVAAMSPVLCDVTLGDVKATAAAGRVNGRADYLTRCTIALNSGMAGNPRVEHPREIATSTQAGAVEWERDGIPVDVAVSVITERCASYTPRGRNRQISSLSYLDAAVREKWDEIRAAVPTAPDGSLKLVHGAKNAADSAWAMKQGYGA